MNWEDQGFLLSKRKFRENANIVNVFTKTFGKKSGIVYGGNSRKIRNYLQISNKIFVINVTKNDNKIGYFKTELIDPISPRYFNDKKRTSALLSLTSLLNILLPEAQPYEKIYNTVNDLFTSLNLENWFILYIFWEISLIKNLGFGVDLNKYSNVINQNKDLIKINIDGINYEVPNFLIKQQLPEKIDNTLIRKSLIFNRTMMNNKFFLPNNLIFPRSRIILENYFN